MGRVNQRAAKDAIAMFQLVQNATLTRQSYGIQMAQVTFGGPTPGIWLECRGCGIGERIENSNTDLWMRIPDSEVSKVFRRNGWTGEGDAMKKAMCPACSTGVGKGETDGEPK